MRRLRRCAFLLGLAWVGPMQAGRTGAQFPVTATIVSSCRSIGVAGSWTRATLPADPSRWVTVDCAGGTAYRVRGGAPAAPPERAVAMPSGGRTTVSEVDGTLTVTIEF
ncbi:MAG: hypothetical protein RJA99_3533 [Pseudomonadota bacterium]|jgi:hypothetical protein